MAPRPVTSQAVTRTEFETFTAHVDNSFTGVTNALTAMNKKLDDRSKPQYGLLVSVVGLIITLVGGGYLVVASQIENSKELAAVRVENLQQQIVFQREEHLRWITRLETLAESK